MKLHQRLQILADGRGMDRAAIAAATGLSPSFVAAALEGRVPMAPLLLTQLLDALGVKLPGVRRDFHHQAAREAGWEIGHP